ncbi:hypothetical protein AVEN_251590-1 [Araneus ventricosus]|uniref:Uncharacterized protein n=1 Tax=Araneus ventricosus TaxID=182803 RepID=A0A4Y2N0W5_ARAVE|nr:hypothetical protein AVEN_7601-1 [Araneus ventricosus]GBN33056.1 hypothetical protein AVEN_251590-1 [Araneus ventricosus]
MFESQTSDLMCTRPIYTRLIFNRSGSEPGSLRPQSRDPCTRPSRPSSTPRQFRFFSHPVTKELDEHFVIRKKKAISCWHASEKILESDHKIQDLMTISAISLS